MVLYNLFQSHISFLREIHFCFSFSVKRVWVHIFGPSFPFCGVIVSRDYFGENFQYYAEKISKYVQKYSRERQQIRNDLH
uniref:CSON008909 protein n=1 Tax=Culicoides sonorensis TaxID=179676 RepID=A0A336KDT9_CULSO